LKEEYEKCKYKGLFIIAVYEIFWNQKRVTYFKQISKRLKRKMKLVHSQIQAELLNLKETTKPKYVRINRLCCSEPTSVILKRTKAELDKDIPDLLVFPDNKLSKLDLSSTDFIVQDKASCTPPFLLQEYVMKVIKEEAKELVVMDACAAPGNKSLQLLQYFGEVICIEKDQKRFNILVKRLKKYAGDNESSAYSTINEDFRKLKEKWEGGRVDYILIDTSCSGTGNDDTTENCPELKEALQECVKDINYTTLHTNLNTKLQEKIKRLSGFQKELLSVALTWKDIKGVVYSTCSIFPQENEEVVQSVLEQHPEYKLEAVPSKIGHPGFIVL
jgi:16S rRNA C967 or C1407 C5-methylase (RsmB/RsmF family)